MVKFYGSISAANVVGQNLKVKIRMKKHEPPNIGTKILIPKFKRDNTCYPFQLCYSKCWL